MAKKNEYISASLIFLAIGKAMHLIVYFLINFKIGGKYFFSENNETKAFMTGTYFGDFFYMIAFCYAASFIYSVKHTSFAAWAFKYSVALMLLLKMVRLLFNLFLYERIVDAEIVMYGVCIVLSVVYGMYDWRRHNDNTIRK